MQTNGGHPRSGGGDGGGATAHSGLSSATAFLQTPAAGAQAQRRLPPLTPTAELGAERGASSAAAAPAVPGPSAAPAPPAASLPGATPAGAAPACCPATAHDRGPALAAPGAKRALPTGGNTIHSLASGSSGGTGGSASGAPSGAEEATATLHSGPARAATPATGAALAAALLSRSWSRCKAMLTAPSVPLLTLNPLYVVSHYGTDHGTASHTTVARSQHRSLAAAIATTAAGPG